MSRHQGDFAYQAYRLLQIAFIVAPILAGLDKFFYLLADWSAYIAPLGMQMINGHDRGFMMFVGDVEIVAGIGMIFKPKIFSVIVAIWLALIIINLLLTGKFFDIILRDVGLLLSVIALSRLSQQYSKE